ncbi:hypothetical protein F4780DRAFT_781351 [Xylariomycetidae sp. FL0641]|nr:hypothetical protein F4780DRAFT_781351 [Xylariomycetidae sp. FL0641]
MEKLLCTVGFVIGLPMGLCGVTIACVWARLYTRLRILYAPGLDDLIVFFYTLAAIASVSAITYMQVESIGEAKGWGSYALYASYCLGTWLVKVALLLQYRRMFDGGTSRALCNMMLIIVTLWGLAFFAVSFFPCWPVSAYWTHNRTGATCWAIGNPRIAPRILLSQAASNAFLDLVVLLLPFPRLIKRETSSRGMIGLFVLFTLGALMLTGAIEHNLACILASIPVFWPEIQKRLNPIVVTREVSITTADRYPRDPSTPRTVQMVPNQLESGMTELWKVNSRRNQPMSDEYSEPRHHTSRTKLIHYQDEYVADQVDPLRNKPAFTVTSKVTSDRKPPKPKRRNPSWF